MRAEVQQILLASLVILLTYLLFRLLSFRISISLYETIDYEKKERKKKQTKKKKKTMFSFNSVFLFSY